MAKISVTDSVNRKQAIQKTAAKLFKEKGYTATSMRHLAEGIGIEAASLYNHISSKEELLRGICFQISDAFFTHLESVENSALTPAAQVEELIRFHIRIRVEQGDEVVVTNNDWPHLKEPYLTDFLQRRRIYQRRWEAIVEKGIEQNLIKPLNPYIIVLTILAGVRSVEYWHRSKRGITAETLENDVLAMLNSAVQVTKEQ